MPQDHRMFLKSAISLAFSAAFCQVAVAQNLIAQSDDGLVSLVKKKPLVTKDPKPNPGLKPEPRTEQDIAVALAPYPGVYVTSLLPNGRFSQISAGGSMPFGVSGVAIIEDGINHAPLAYLDNSLINLSLASIESIEVLHSPQTAFGPNGLGGTINLVGQQIPSVPTEGAFELGYGSHNQALVDLDVGHQKENWGSLFSFNRQQGDSYRAFKGQEPEDFSANDFMVRVRETAPPRKHNWQQTELKVQYKDYRNNESRFGISRQDLAANPRLRYMATAQDNEYQEQLNIHLKHQTRLDNDELVTANAYYNDGEAGYYQTTGVNGMSGDSAARALGAFEASAVGQVDIDKTRLERTYSSWGAQLEIEQQIERHNISLAIRYHTESLIDQLLVDSFAVDEQLVVEQPVQQSDTLAYKDTARVKSVYLNDRWRSGQWDIGLGARYEEINIRREGTNIVDDQLGESNQNVTILNADVNYNITDNLRLSVSGHQGYQPSRSSTMKVEAQESLIVRSGISYQLNDLQLSAVAFSNAFTNLLGDCRATIGCVGNHNVGDARVSGAEVSMKNQWYFGRYTLPIEFAYTHNNGEFERDFDSSALGANVNKGDLLPFVPRNLVYLKLGLAAEKWQVNASVQFRDKQRTTPGVGYDNAFETLDDVTLLNLDANYQLANNQQLYLKVNNVTDEVYGESSMHAGVLAGKERTISLGYKFKF